MIFVLLLHPCLAPSSLPCSFIFVTILQLRLAHSSSHCSFIFLLFLHLRLWRRWTTSPTRPPLEIRPTHLTVLHPVQNSGEVDTKPHPPSSGSIASLGESRLPPWSINGGPGNSINTMHRRQLSDNENTGVVYDIVWPHNIMTSCGSVGSTCSCLEPSRIGTSWV